MNKPQPPQRKPPRAVLSQPYRAGHTDDVKDAPTDPAEAAARRKFEQASTDKAVSREKDALDNVREGYD